MAKRFDWLCNNASSLIVRHQQKNVKRIKKTPLIFENIYRPARNSGGHDLSHGEHQSVGSLCVSVGRFLWRVSMDDKYWLFVCAVICVIWFIFHRLFFSSHFVCGKKWMRSIESIALMTKNRFNLVILCVFRFKFIMLSAQAYCSFGRMLLQSNTLQYFTSHYKFVEFSIKLLSEQRLFWIMTYFRLEKWNF